MSNQDADYGRPTCPTCGLTLSMFDPPQEHDHDADTEAVGCDHILITLESLRLRDGTIGEVCVHCGENRWPDEVQHSDGSTRNEENR